MEDFTLNEMLTELEKAELHWINRQCNNYLFYFTSVSGYDIQLTKILYKDGYSICIELSYKNNERDDINLIRFKVMNQCVNNKGIGYLSDSEKVVESDERDSLIRLFDKLERISNESIAAINMITKHLRKLNS